MSVLEGTLVHIINKLSWVKQYLSEKDRNNINAIIGSINKIEKFIGDFEDADQLEQDELVLDATLMNFVVIGETSIKISSTFKLNHTDIDWRGIKDFRNFIAHEYFSVNVTEVWQIIKDHLPILKSQLLNILEVNKTDYWKESYFLEKKAQDSTLWHSQ